MESDDWRPVEGFPGYSINPLGHVVRDSTGRLLVPRYNQYGVPYVGLMRDWQQCIRSLPRMVARAFLSRPSEIFDTPIQLDGDPMNCQVDNLMWRPRWYAVLYKRQFDERYDYSIDEPVHAVNERERFPNSLLAACRYGLLEREVVLSILNRTPSWPTYQYFELVTMR
jgi:NUMOD4 motif